MYVIEIGRNEWYVSDDEPPATARSKARTYPTLDEAMNDAKLIKQNWNLKAARGAAKAVYVVQIINVD